MISDSTLAALFNRCLVVSAGIAAGKHTSSEAKNYFQVFFSISRISDTANRHVDDIIDTHRFLHYKGLSVFCTNQISIKPRHSSQALPHFDVRRE